MRLVFILITILLVLSAMFIYFGCGSSEDNEDSKIDETPKISLPEATTESVWKYIIQDNPYTAWDTFPKSRIPEFAIWKDDYIKPTTKVSFLAGYVEKVYINNIGLSALGKEPRNLPYGTIIVIDYHPTQGDNVSSPSWIAGRYKVKGSTARDNDWVTFGYNPDGTLFDIGYGPTFGTKTYCYHCHEASQNDYTWLDSPKYDASYSNVPALEDSKPRP